MPCAGVCVTDVVVCGFDPCFWSSLFDIKLSLQFDQPAAVMYKDYLQPCTPCSCDALAHHLYELMHLQCISNNRCCSLARKPDFFYCYAWLCRSLLFSPARTDPHQT